MPEGKPVEIKPAKGRPMLTWVGKRPLRNVIAYPAQLVEAFSAKEENSLVNPDTDWSDWPQDFPKTGLLFHGDNKDVLAYLLANGFRERVKLIYIDPPFNTGIDYVRKITLRGKKMDSIEAEGYSFAEQIQYENSWLTDIYLQNLYERLYLCKELLTNDGIIFIRLDVHFGFYLRLIADEIFGRDAFQNEIVVNRIKKNVTNKGRRTIPNAVDYLYVYFKSFESEFKNVLRELPETKPGYWHNVDSPGIPGPRELVLGGKKYYPSPGTHLKFTQKQADEMWAKGKLRENPTSGKLEYWVEEKNFVNLDSNWTDIPGYSFKTGYPTENSEQLLERVILAGSSPNEIVMDFYCGSGTTAAIAQLLGRRWIACDINKGAIQTTIKRIKRIIQDQTSVNMNTAIRLPGIVETKTSPPCQLSFSIFRVNDYDLQIQHNEAFNLAVDHLGMTRTKTDSFFDGTLGKRLVKIIPFNHPLTPLDLEEVKNELRNRPDESRDITVVCLGKELAVDAWLEDWNRIRRKGDFPNKIEVIELRSDPKYGGFFVHQPAQAQVKFERVEDGVQLKIEEFISPTIIERLSHQAGGPLLKPQITEWRAMVDSVMIDANYDGQVFNIILADVPEKKSDLVKGEYKVDAPPGAKIAVKITDMLGEEVLVVEEV